MFFIPSCRALLKSKLGCGGAKLSVFHSFLLVAVIVPALLSCEGDVSFFRKKSNTLDTILKNKQLTVITRNSSHCYYIYRDQEMGFEYDLSKAFADYLGVNLRIIIADKWDRMIPDLMNRTGDLIAASMTITPNRRQQVAFSDGYMDIKQNIIVHRSDAGLRTLSDLDGKWIYVRQGTSYQEHLERVKMERPNLKFEIVALEDVPTEELIRQVAEREIEVTIADSNVAMLNRRYYPHAIIAGSISETEQLGWAVHPDAKDLLKEVNAFFKQIKRSGRFTEIYNRYYANVEQFDFVDLRKFHRQIASRLPKYQPYIKKASDANDFDWRLIAAQMYQESHFNPKARSHAGAFGLMQLTRRTADSFGVTHITDPKENIFAGVKFLRYLYDYFEIESESDRLKISLAAYNIGQGHVRDAQKLAVQLRLDPVKWDSIKKTLPLLRYRRYYQNTTYGYCRGTEPVKYVRQIMIYYDILKRQAIEFLKVEERLPARASS